VAFQHLFTPLFLLSINSRVWYILSLIVCRTRGCLGSARLVFMHNCYYTLFAVEFSHAAGISDATGIRFRTAECCALRRHGGPNGASGSAANARVSGKPSRPLVQPLLNVSRGLGPGPATLPSAMAIIAIPGADRRREHRTGRCVS